MINLDIVTWFEYTFQNIWKLLCARNQRQIFSFINWLPLCNENLRRSNNRNEGSLSIYKWIFWRMFIFETSDVPKKSLLCRTNKYSIEKTFSTCSTSFVFIWLGVVRLKSNKNTHVHMIDARQFKQENRALIENYISFCSCHITTCCYPIHFYSLWYQKCYLLMNLSIA